MAGLLDPVKDLLTSLTQLALVGSLLKPLPPLVGNVQPTVNGLGLLPLGLRLDARPSGPIDPALCSIVYDVAAPVVTFDPFNSTLADLYRYRQQQAVNMGGWFVNEAWMSPSLFSCAANNRSSEIDLAAGFGKVDTARQALEQHWDSWIDLAADFAYLSSIGINTIRLPIGAWSLGPEFISGTAFEPYAGVYNNSWTRVKNVIAKAAAYDLGVLVDLHGAAASQNGLPHSGVSDGKEALFSDPAMIAATQKALVFLAKELASVTNVVGIELLNEPAEVPQLEQFYADTMAQMRAFSPEAASLPIYISDAFNIARMAPFIGNRSDFVVLDKHSYFVFDAKNATSAAPGHDLAVLPSDVAAGGDSATNSSQPWAAVELLELASNLTHRNLIVGEFSCALSNDSLATQAEPLDARRRYCQSQIDLYTNQTAGFGFWSYKLESCEPGWCFRSAVGTALPSHFSLWSRGAGKEDHSKDFDILSKVALIAQKAESDILTGVSSSSAAPASASAASSLPAQQYLADAPSTADLAAEYAASSSTDSALADEPTDAPLEKRHRGLHHSRYRYNGQRVHPRDFLPSRRAVDFTPEEKIIVRAYADGFETAKTFAAADGSKLGFVDQWISDAMKRLTTAGELEADFEGLYPTYFRQGLKEAEDQITVLMTTGP